MSVKHPTFLSLLDIHEHLNEMFLLHQEALLDFDVDLALARLRQFENKLRAVFKQLMQHHDMREQSILYPTLDKVTSEEERRVLLIRCQDEATAE
jgi:hypothetical protein